MNLHCLSCNISLAITAPGPQQNSHHFPCLKSHMNPDLSKGSSESLGLSWKEKHSGRWHRSLGNSAFGYNLTLVKWGLSNKPTQLLWDCIKSQDEAREGLCTKLSLPQHTKAGKVTSCCITDGQRDCED